MPATETASRLTPYIASEDLRSSLFRIKLAPRPASRREPR